VKVLVDTSIWSLALRKASGPDPRARQQLAELIAGHRAQIIGPIRQELLSGIKDERQFEDLSGHLSAFPDLPVVADDYVMAAKFFNLCRKNGIQGSNTDFLICAVAIRNRLSILTADDDFRQFSKVLPISLSE
jgi:predicted nucleic acid-binding protein